MKIYNSYNFILLVVVFVHLLFPTMKHFANKKTSIIYGSKKILLGENVCNTTTEVISYTTYNKYDIILPHICY
jgi:hypothetical protein